MALGGTITAGSGAVNLTSTTPGQSISLGAGSTGLGLSNAALNTISTTGTLTIGDILHSGTISTDGAVSLTGPTGPVVLQTSGGAITLNNSFTTAGNLTLDTTGSGAVTGAVSGAGQLTVGAGGANSLTVNASTGISLTNVSNLANAVTLNNSTAGSVSYKNNRSMTLAASNAANGGTISVVNATGNAHHLRCGHGYGNRRCRREPADCRTSYDQQQCERREWIRRPVSCGWRRNCR